MGIFIVAAGIAILIALVLRFVQPELIYSLRQALIRIRTNKLFIDQDAGRKIDPHELRELILTDRRFETRAYDTKYLLQRVTKIRELSRMLDPRRSPEGTAVPLAERICIMELADMLKNLAEELVPRKEYFGPTLGASALLQFIAEKRREVEGWPKLTEERDIENWYISHPISMEQTVELLTAAVFALAYRQRVEKEDAELEFQPATDPDIFTIISVLEKRLRGVVRQQYEFSMKTLDKVHEKFETVLGNKEYAEIAKRLKHSRNSGSVAIEFMDFMYLKQISQLMFAEWQWFAGEFGEKIWLNSRLEKIIQVRNDLAHSRIVNSQDSATALRYCEEIKKRLDKFIDHTPAKELAKAVAKN
jgi:hypothetical protein